MSIRIKKKSRLYKLIQQTRLVEKIIFEYLNAECLSLLLLDKIVYHTLIGRINSRINEPLYEHFRHFKEEILTNHQKENWEQEIEPLFMLQSFDQQIGNRYLYLELELKYSIMYSYEYRKNESQKAKQYFWTLEFFLTSKSQRKIWMVKQKHIYAELPTYLMDALQVRSNDVISLLIPFYILGKPVKKLKFYPINSTQQYCFENPIQNICSWTLQKPLKKTIDFQVEQLTSGLQKYFKTLNVSYSTNQKYYKIELLCTAIFQQVKIFDCFVKSVQPSAFLQISLKKKGSFMENYSTLHLAIGDILVLYLIKS